MAKKWNWKTQKRGKAKKNFRNEMDLEHFEESFKFHGLENKALLVSNLKN